MKMPSQNGFTLVEMAIVLAIVALVLGTGLTIISAQQYQRKVDETRDRLSDAREALIGYAIVNGYLPCPADPTIPSGSANAGIERAHNATGCAPNADAVQGDLPWATLGLPETDAWGHRYTYRVAALFAAQSTPPVSLSTTGDIDVGTTAGTSDLASNMPAIVVSHGANGLGAYLPTGLQILPVPTAITNEGENTDVDSYFVSHTLATTNEVGGYFDDQLVWLSQYTLFNRMVQAEKLP